MADDLPDAPWTTKAEGDHLPDAPWAVAPSKTFGEKLGETWPVRLLKPAVTGAALPGQVAQGSLDVTPQTPGMWSDEDEARLQLTNAEITKRAVEAAPFASPTPAAMRGAGAEGIFGVPTTGPVAPSLGQLKQAAVAGYEHPTVQGVKLDAGAGPALADQIYAAFNQPGVDIHKALVPRTSAVLDDLYKIPAPKAGEPDPFLTVANLRTVYRQLGKAAASPDATERLAAKSAQQHIHEFLANMPEGYVIKGDPKAAGEIIQEANTNYAGMKRAEDLDLRLTRAYVRAAGANSGMNVGNTIRQRMADVVANPNLARRIPADELAMMKGIAEGNSGTNLMRYVSNFLGGGGGALSAIWSLSGHHLLPVAGYALRRLYNSNVGRAADVLQGTIRQRTPLGQQMLHEPVEPGLLGARTVPKLGPAVGPSVGAPGLPAVYGQEQQDNDKRPPGQHKGGRINAQRQRFADGGAPDDPYDPLAASAGIAPPGPTPVGSAMLQHTIDLAAAPGRVAAGQQPQTPGMWSDVDEAQAQANARGLQVGAPEAATMMMGSGTPFAMAEHGALGITGGRMPVGEAKAPPLYSAVERAVADSKTPQAPAQQWLGTLKNAPGVKPEELETLGVEDFLKGQKGPVTKQALAEHIAENKVDVQDVHHTEPLYYVSDRNGIIKERGLSNEEARSRAKEIGGNYQVEDEHAPTKFGQYTLPGGENYRELLLTLPDRSQARLMRAEADKRGYPDRIADWPDQEFAQRYRNEVTNNPDVGSENFRSSHWDEPNVLAHVRFDDRNIGGDKTLHMAEVQSDWHQKGRREGYATPEAVKTSGWNVRPNPDVEGEFEVVDNVGRVRYGTTDEADARQYIADQNRIDTRHLVPNAPFKTTWPELALKRMIRYAAENGYDRISWDTGLTNAERYDLSKQIKRLEYSPTHNLRAWSTEGKAVIDEAVPPEKLPDYIGKEAADKLMNAPTFESGAGRQVKYLEGMDLKVGGEGMKAFYDRMLPNVANKLVKKYGARVENAGISTGPSKYTIEPSGSQFIVKGGDSGNYGIFHTKEEAERVLSELRATDEKYAKPVHSIKITPELRDQALHRGFPMFSTGIPIPPHSTDKRETQGYAKGGAVNGKATKAAAEYKTKGHPPRICATCTMFRPPSFCTAVKGQISPQAVCKFFEAKKGRASGGRIDASHTVRTGANSSADGTVYVDPSIPAKFRKFLAVHETTEQRHMAGGYARAHKIATAAERKAVEASGMSWRHYTAEMDGYLDHIEHEKDTNPPKGKLHVSAGVALGHHRSGNK